MYRIKWLASTCPPDGARRDTMYLGAAVITNTISGSTVYCAGRFAFLGSPNPAWLEPFLNDYASEAEALAGFRHMTLEFEHVSPYAR
jgi:hypothetical protein